METAPHGTANGAVVNRPVLVTGASGGIGLEVIGFLLDQGFRRLICCYRTNPAPLAALLERFDLDPNVHSFRVDLTQEGDVQSLREHVESHFGTPWGIVCLAGASRNAMSWKAGLDDFRHVLDANFLSTFLTCRAFIPAMREQCGGRIITAASVVAFTGTVGAGLYCAAKAAIVGWSKALAQELASRGITVNALALGYFDRGVISDVPQAMRDEICTRTPLRRLGSGREAAAAVAYLLGDEAGFVTGQSLHINGGLYS